MAAGGVLALSLTSTTHAHAALSPAEIERQIDEAWNKLEPLLEQHNGIKVQLADNRAKVDKLSEQIRPLQQQVDVAMGRVSSISVQAYKNGQTSTFNALLNSGSPATLASQLTMLDAMARSEQASVADVVRLKTQYDEQKRPLDEMIAKLSTQEAEISAQEKALNDQIAGFNKLRLEAYGGTQATGNLRPAACPASYDGSTGSKAAQVACQQIGKPYVFNTEGPGTFDCSGLTKYAWAQATRGKVSLYHYTNTQFSSTQRVSKNELRVGDLVFYYPDLHHVAIYVGNNWMVHAPQAGQPVQMQRADQQPVSGYGRPRA